MKTVLKVALGIILGLTVLIVGCAVIVGVGVNDAVDKVDKDNQKTAVTQAQIDRIKPGKSRASVERLLGKPAADDIQTSVTSDGKDVTVYYPVKNGNLLDRYQINYGTNGIVESVNKF